MGKFGPHIQNCLFKVKLDTKTNLNMQNSMMVSILSVLDWKQLLFLDKLGPKNQNCQFKLKIGTKTNSNMKKSMVIFTFSVFDRTYSFFFFFFWKFVPKIKIVCWSWNLEPTMIFIFWDFLMFYQIFLSPKLKGSAISSMVHMSCLTSCLTT